MLLSNKGRRAGCEEEGRVSDEKVEASLSLIVRVLFSRVHSVDLLTVAYRTRLVSSKCKYNVR